MKKFLKSINKSFNNVKKGFKNFGKHLSAIGFTNRLAVYIILFLLTGLIGGFILAVMSIKAQFDGALMCWTIVFTPIGTATAIVLSMIVNKSKAENTEGGIKYESIMQEFGCSCTQDYSNLI